MDNMTVANVPPTSPPLRVAVIGAGARAQDHLAAIARMPQYWQLSGVCDARPDRAQAASEQHGVPAFGDPLQLLSDTRADAVLVIVPPDGHHPLVLAAAERGVHVMTEVPISISLPLADLMIEACRRSHVVLEVAENVWRRPVAASSAGRHNGHVRCRLIPLMRWKTTCRCGLLGRRWRLVIS
jgi:predicted dehydrogenase